MIRPTLIFIILAFTLSTLTVQADSWVDPNWKEMIDSSDVIALVEYTSNGDFRAKAKPITIYKGQLSSGEIWISGFSNRYGPIDKMSIGDKYIVFLNYNKPTDRSLEYWQEQIKEEPELTAYYEALKAGNAYYVWSPTSGDLKVEGGKVQYDLLQTSYYNNQEFYPLAEFEDFLKATTKKKSAKFHKEILKKVNVDATKDNSAQHLMMLHLTSFKTYHPIFQVIADEQKPEACYALAQLLGAIKGEKSRNILVQLLHNKNSIVQGEVVRQLSNQDPSFIGPILLAHLDSAGEGGIYPSNLMDPVMNRVDGGKIEIIKTLGKLKYKPAAKALLPLLETEDAHLFELVVNVLIELGNKDFVPYINDHLKKRTPSLLFKICQLITDHNLTACKPALMEFISNHNRNDHPSYEYSISSFMGLAHFDDQETRDFLLKDFENLLTNQEIESGKLNDWIREYIETFKDLKSTEARPLIYKSLFKWFGFNYDFALHPELFEIKRKIENSISQKAQAILSGNGVEEIQTIVFINNTEEFGKNFSPSYYPIILIKLDRTELNPEGNNEIWAVLKNVQEKLSKELTIPMEQISSKSGSYIHNLDDRFEGQIDWSPMNMFYQYAKELPNENDLLFLKSLKQSGFAKDDFDKKQLDRAIKEIEVKLKK
ncbi:HEAT repeat domain-containing protein [Rufibacter roseus]|uniref:HEAT repeat domain-containing protein n=1 Tax=Rufibacter roseus TaxID=1567108 RepID=A0ABW2DSK0_9BACT|nr:HEAT repeat domain-containing protein [Rufibacter roseus]